MSPVGLETDCGSKPIPATSLKILNFGATRVAFAEIVERCEGSLRVAVVGHSFVIDLAVIIKQTKAVFEQRSFRFVVVATRGAEFLAVVNEVVRDGPHGLTSVQRGIPNRFAHQRRHGVADDAKLMCPSDGKLKPIRETLNPRRLAGRQRAVLGRVNEH